MSFSLAYNLFFKNTLTKVSERAVIQHFDKKSKLVFMSDCHRGINDNADDFSHNSQIHAHALKCYYEEGFSYYELGDGDELWENRDFRDIYLSHSNIFRWLRKFHRKNRLHLLWGNHDMDRNSRSYVIKTLAATFNPVTENHEPLFPDIKVEEAIKLVNEEEDLSILLIHGHQVDPPNYQLWWFNKFLVRYFWRGMQQIGFRNPASPSHNMSRMDKVENRLSDWIKANDNQMLIAGHTHQARFPNAGKTPYFNDGSCIHPRCITAIEIEEMKISLVKWSIDIQEDGSLKALRSVLGGPIKLSAYK